MLVVYLQVLRWDYCECLGRTGGLGAVGVPLVDMSSIEQATVHLPVGTVTFLLTDIEGSTRLWESALG